MIEIEQQCGSAEPKIESTLKSNLISWLTIHKVHISLGVHVIPGTH